MREGASATWVGLIILVEPMLLWVRELRSNRSEAICLHRANFMGCCSFRPMRHSRAVGVSLGEISVTAGLVVAMSPSREPSLAPGGIKFPRRSPYSVTRFSFDPSIFSVPMSENTLVVPEMRAGLLYVPVPAGAPTGRPVHCTKRGRLACGSRPTATCRRSRFFSRLKLTGNLGETGTPPTTIVGGLCVKACSSSNFMASLKRFSIDFWAISIGWESSSFCLRPKNCRCGVLLDSDVRVAVAVLLG